MAVPAGEEGSIDRHAPLESDEWVSSSAVASSSSSVMDLDEGAGLEGHWPHPGAARADDGEARRLSGDLPISLTRWEPLRAYVPTMSALELIIMLLFFRSANTVDNKARFADLGITKKESSRAQKLAALPEETFQKVRSGEIPVSNIKQVHPSVTVDKGREKAIQHAVNAINELKKIPVNEESRREAFKMVKNYINQNSKEAA